MAKKYEELTFHDDFMFCKVLETHPDLCRKLLELALGRKLGDLVSVNRQKPVEILPDRRGVRFDIYVEDGNNTVYDVEMQNANRDSIAKRTRYSQAMIDLNLLERGKRYKDLDGSYIIFICRFNLFEQAGLHKYSFLNLCREDPGIELGDSTEKIFLCSTGNANDISEEMQSFLRYIAEGIPCDSFTRKLEDAVEEARVHIHWRQEYMTFLEQLEIEREEGRAEGREEGRAEERVNTEREKQRADAAESELQRLREEIAELRKDITTRKKPE